jgi:mannose-1-phosphate guanylyltransferase
MKAMILAAGLGTRLRPLTYTMPKPMVPVLNRPLIAWAIDAFLRVGVDEIVINLHHLPEPLERYVEDEFGDRCRFHFSFEQEILGTSGGIRRVRKALENPDGFYVVNGDTVQSPPYERLRAARDQFDALATLTLRHPPANDRFTAVWLDEGRITGFGQGTGEALMFSGSHLISNRIFDLIPDKEFSGIVDEVYMPQLAAGSTIAGVVDDGPWFDVGSPKRLIGASRDLLLLATKGTFAIPHGSELRNGSLIHRDAIVNGYVTSSTIGAGSQIDGTVLDSAVWDRCVVPAGTSVTSSIVAHGVKLPTGMTFSNVLICNDDPAIPADVPRVHGLVITAI